MPKLRDSYACHRQSRFKIKKDPVSEIANEIFQLNGNAKIDGIIIDNQLGSLVYRVPATAARIQQALMELMYPDQAAAGIFHRFKEAIEFYNQNFKSFAFDIMTLEAEEQRVAQIARAYVESGKYQNVVSVYLGPDSSGQVMLHSGKDFTFKRPQARHYRHLNPNPWLLCRLYPGPERRG